MSEMKTLTINGKTYVISDPDAPIKTLVSEGRTARYTVSSSGWKRVMVMLRTHSGIMNFGVVRAYPNYMGQAVGIDFTGFVKYGRDTTTDKKPVLIQRYNNVFGEDNALENPAVITKVRIGYPKQGTDFPNSDGAVADYTRNPINCYLDMYVEFDPSTASSGEVSFGLNYAGLSDNHNCMAFAEETNATDAGIYGEELEYYTLTLKEGVYTYMPDGKMEVAEIIINGHVNGLADNEISTKSGWSSDKIVEQLCPTFEETGGMVSCYPVQYTTINAAGFFNTAQKLYHCGKNLLDWNNPNIAITESQLLAETIIKGVTFKNWSNWFFFVSGEAVSQMFINIGEVSLPAGTYTYAINNAQGIRDDGLLYGQLYALNADGTLGKSLATQVGYKKESATFTLAEDTTVRARLLFKPGAEFSTYLRPQIEVGEVATNAEKYKGEVVQFSNNISKTVKFTAFEGVNHLYVYPSGKSLSVRGYADPKAMIEKLTNAIIALGGNI